MEEALREFTSRIQDFLPGGWGVGGGGDSPSRMQWVVTVQWGLKNKILSYITESLQQSFKTEDPRPFLIWKK